MEEDRAEQMAARLHLTATRAGLSGENADLLVECYRFAMRRRAEAFSDPHHPDFLHPARSALILMDDMGVTDAACLAAAVMHDSERGDLGAAATDVERLAGPEAARLAAQLPPANLDDAELAEQLVVSEPAALAAALAERLDHVRHLHFRPAESWPAVYHRACSVLLPVAARCHPRLVQRYQAWCDAFARRLRGASNSR
jgi:(p)ppGpp synthase/HD superfamily hydrolase